MTGAAALLGPIFVFFFPEYEVNFLDLDPRDLYGFPTGWQTVTWLSGYFHFLLGVVIVIFVCNEFSVKAARQHVIDGLTRDQYFAGKILLLLAYSLLSTIMAFLTGVICSLYYTGGLADFGSGMEFLLIYFYQTFAYLTFALMFGFLLRKSGYAILLFMLVVGTEFIIRQFIDKSGYIAQYFPLRIIGNMVTMPDVQSWVSYLLEETKGDVETVIMPQNLKLAWGAFWSSAFLGVSYWSLKKRTL